MQTTREARINGRVIVSRRDGGFGAWETDMLGGFMVAAAAAR